MKQPVMMLVAVVALTLSMGFTQNKTTTIALDNFNEMQPRNVKTEQVAYKGRKALRVTDAAAANVADGIQLVVLNKTEFQDGVIEIELTGEPAANAGAGARGFVGVAFRVSPDAAKYECFYLRPTNGRADDQVRRNHSTQYISYPDFPWQRLRKEFPEKYESLAQETYDVILRNGTILDGTGAKGRRADIAVRNGFIYRIGDLRGVRATVELEVTGLIVAPGFINLHSHADPAGVRTAVNMLTQGVTTEIINADGAGSLNLTQQLASFSTEGLAVNLGAYIGFNSVWASVVGQADRRPDAAAIQKMRELLTESLKQGAWGVSAGLDYKPGYFAHRDEVIAVMQAATPWRTNFPNHDRLTPESNFSSLAGIEETIEIGKKSNVMPVVTHIKVQGHEQGNAAKVIAMMRAASARGHETVADIYPYLAGQTGLGAVFVPAWAMDGGRVEMLKRFADPTLRPRIAQEIEAAIKARILSPENIYVASRQRQFSEYMRELKAGAGETMISLLEKDNPFAILKFGAEEDLIALLQYPGSAVSCDCGARPTSPSLHPRYFGTFPRVLGHYVRETKTLTLEDAVRRMTGLPAHIIGLADRGFLAVGMVADITVFDPTTIIDRATYEQPTLLSEGVRHVLVNGRFALRDGQATGEKAGRVLNRTADLPSRPMRMQQPRSLAVTTKDFSINLTQTANAKPHGTARFRDPKTGTEFRLLEAGLLQTHNKWASFTARVRTKESAAEQLALVVLDGGNPMRTQATIRVELSDGRRVEAPLKPREFKVSNRR